MWEMKLIFCMKISMKVSNKLILWFLMGMVKHFQRFQNSKFVIFLQYIKTEVRDEVYFLIVYFWASKFPTKWYYHYWWAWLSILKVLKVSIIVFDGSGQTWWSWYFFNILRKKGHNCFLVLLCCKTFRYFMAVQSCLLLLVH